MQNQIILDAITIGEAMALFVAGQTGELDKVAQFSRFSAGAELNVAVGLSRLGLRVGYVSRVGRDSFGRYLMGFLNSEGVDHQCVMEDADHSTGFMLKALAAHGEDPIVESFRRGSAASHMGLSDYSPEYCKNSRHLHLTGISVALSDSVQELAFQMATDAKRDSRSISLDPNLRPRLWPSKQAMIDTINRLASYADIVMPGLSEGELLTGREGAERVADFYLNAGAKQVVVKLGPQGAYYADHQNCGTVTGVAVKRVVDTVGAGDGFAVGVVSALLEGLPLVEAVRRGNAIGARVVQFPGDCDGLPNRAQLNAVMEVPGDH